MVLLNNPLCSLWILWLLSGIARSQDNPFGGQPAVQQPVDDNPFASVGGAGVAPPVEDDNPFKPPTEGSTGGVTPDDPNPFAPVSGATCGSAASLDPSNPAGTCCCDPKKTYQLPSTPQLQGGCCAKGNKWSCSCQDGGSFKFNPLACPVLHRNSRITPAGPTFELFCNVQTHRKDLKAPEPAESFIECVDSCGATPGCMGVDFDKVAKQCYLKSEYMDENTSGAVNNDVDSATMTPLKCPDINGQLRTIGGVEYEISCDKPVSTDVSKIKSLSGARTAEACALRCSAMPDCQGFNFRDSDKGCFTHTVYQNPPLGNEAGFITLIPTKPR
ncbi:MAG: hypothetical protein L6R35_002825 [Caloplaca aegaea]|nr:MAG: hypothetical protein L6R35_002825 [Caloplaca aegaea]